MPAASWCKEVCDQACCSLPPAEGILQADEGADEKELVLSHVLELLLLLAESALVRLLCLSLFLSQSSFCL